jgi:hypothetical protein
MQDRVGFGEVDARFDLQHRDTAIGIARQEFRRPGFAPDDIDGDLGRVCKLDSVE